MISPPTSPLLLNFKAMQCATFLDKNKFYPKTVYSYIILLILFAGSSCKKNFDYHPNVENQLVVLAEITANDTSHIPVSQSIVAGSGTVIDFQQVNNAAVSITDQNGQVRQLTYSTSPNFSGIPAGIYTHPGLFKAAVTYSLQVGHPSLPTVSASTYIPAVFSIANIESEEEDFHGKPVLEFSFNVKDNAGEKNYYIFEAVKELIHLFRYFYWQGVLYDYDTPEGKQLYEHLIDEGENVKLNKDTLPTNKFLRLNTFTSDPLTANSQLHSLDSSFNRIFLTDSLFNGQTYATSFFIDRTFFKATNPDEKGIVEIRIKSVDKAFYDYLLQYEKYKIDFGTMPVNQLTTPVGNIQNGLGIFGGSYMNEKKYYYDVL